MREYLDPIVEDEQCEQYKDGNGIPVTKSTQFTWNIRALFESICKAGLKTTTKICHFGVRQFELFITTISPKRVSLQAHKTRNFLIKLRYVQSKKDLQCHLGLEVFSRSITPGIVMKLNPSYKQLKPELFINITSEIKKIFDSRKKAPNDAFHLA